MSEVIVAFICGVIMGATGTFIIAFVFFVTTKYTSEKDRFTLFSELTEMMSNPDKPLPVVKLQPVKDKKKKKEPKEKHGGIKTKKSE